MTGAITVLIVDDHAIYRSALRAYLDRAAEVRVLAEAVDGPSAVRLAVELRPDVVIMDISLPDFDGIEATRRIKRQCPAAGVVAMSGAIVDEETRAQTVRAGAVDLLDKACALEALLPAIRSAAGRDG